MQLFRQKKHPGFVVPGSIFGTTGNMLRFCVESFRNISLSCLPCLTNYAEEIRYNQLIRNTDREGKQNMKIYLDIFFLVNACLNFIILMAECMFRKQKNRLARILLASLAGAVMAVVILVCGVHTYKILFALLYLPGVFILVYIAFGKTTFPTFLVNTVVFYVMSAVLAALLMQLQNMIGTGGKISVLLLGSAVFLGIVYRFMPVFEKEEAVRRNYYRVCLKYGDKKIYGTGLLDTGNHLTEPFFHKPVAIGERMFLSKLFTGEKEPVFRYIPFHTIGNSGAVIAAFQADEMILDESGGKKQRILKPWIAVAAEGISLEKEYQVILHPDMFRNRMPQQQETNT